MLRPVCFAVALAVSTLALAQQADSQSSAASAETTPPTTVAPVKAVYGILKKGTEGADSYSDFCDLTSSKSLPTGALVVVMRTVSCQSIYGGGSFNKSFLEILYSGKKLLVPEGAVFLTKEYSKKFDALDPATIDASVEDWTRDSLLAKQMQTKASLAALKATAKHGIAILKASIFDVSEHTEGTGFKVTVYNSGRKTIKYVTFSVMGLNAVKDPVRDRLRNTSAPMLRGIGPIEPGDTASYSKDYMWMTDIVEYFRISQIKLEFTDGSSKVLTDMKSLRIKDEDYEMLTADDED